MSALWGSAWGRAWMRLTPIRVQVEGVQVWRADLDHPPLEVNALAQTLSGDERTRAGRFHRQRDRGRFVAARGLLRVLLGDALSCPPSSLRFRYNAHGKPALAPGDALLGFNLSHSDGAALFALAWGREVGVDIERVHPQLAAVSLAERYLPADEAAALLSLPPACRSTAFTQAWVRHEAFTKALGMGFFSPPPSSADPQWTCLDLEAGPDYRAALVMSARHYQSIKEESEHRAAQ